MNNRAVIFDLDGVVVDTQGIHAEVDALLLARFGVKLTPEEITRRYAGVPTRVIFRELVNGGVDDSIIRSLVQEKRQMMIDHVKKCGVDPIPGALNLVSALEGIGVPLAIGSASNIHFVELVLTKIGLIQFFDEIVSGDQVKKGKPDPETFLVAGRRLGVAPRNCIVVEDGVSGMQAAISAGMACLALVPDVNEDYPTPNRVTTLEGIDTDWLLNLQP
jgi:beta-phosphoglucomutase family hydrolase